MTNQRIRTVRTFLVLLLAFIAGACSMSADIALAEKQVPQFHALLDEGRTKEMYNRGSSDLKNFGPEKDFVALLDAVHRKLGTVQNTEQQSWNIEYHT